MTWNEINKQVFICVRMDPRFSIRHVALHCAITNDARRCFLELNTCTRGAAFPNWSKSLGSTAMQLCGCVSPTPTCFEMPGYLTAGGRENTAGTRGTGRRRRGRRRGRGLRMRRRKEKTGDMQMQTRQFPPARREAEWAEPGGSRMDGGRGLANRTRNSSAKSVLLLEGKPPVEAWICVYPLTLTVKLSSDKILSCSVWMQPECIYSYLKYILSCINIFHTDNIVR